jgi:predicted nucleotidyltransferase
MSALEDAFLETQIFGSLARGTAVRPISDIDVLVLFRGRPTVEDPKLAYRILESALKRIYGGRVVDKKAILRNTSRRQRVFSSFGASIIVDLPQGWLEVLPAVTSNSQAERFFVPDRLLRNWIPTNHEIHARSTQKREIESGGMYSSLVKATKWWQHFQASGQKYLSGFVLECLVAAHADLESESLLVSFGMLMRRIRKKYPTHHSMLRVPELGVPSGFKQTNLTKHRYYRFKKIIDQTVKLTGQVQAAKSLDEELEIWQRVFGPEFPRKLS